MSKNKNKNYSHLIELGIFFAALIAIIIPMQITQNSRTDKLYEMFIDLLKEGKTKQPCDTKIPQP